MNEYINDYFENRIKTKVNFRLIRNRRRRVTWSNGKSKLSSTIDILRIDFETYRKWIEYQTTPEMNWPNIEIDHVRPISSSDISKEDEIKNTFNWKNKQRLFKQTHQQKG